MTSREALTLARAAPKTQCRWASGMNPHTGEGFIAIQRGTRIRMYGFLHGEQWEQIAEPIGVDFRPLAWKERRQ